MKITFEMPITIGDVQKQTQVESMEVVTVAFNLAPFSGGGNAVVSVTLRDRVTGHQVHYCYEDSTHTPEFWQAVSGLQINGESWLAPLLKRLVSDGKLRAGTLS